MQSPVLILGATGTLGGAICRRLSGAVPLLIHGRFCDERLETLAAETGANTVSADLTDASQVTAMFGAIEKLSGLIFAVGTTFPHKLTRRTPWEVFQAQIDNQLKALHLSLSAGFDALKAGGKVVILSTEYILGMPPVKIAPYLAAKAAMTTYAKVIAQEWLPHDVRVHILAPGMVPSALTEGLPAAYLEQVAAGMPEKKLTTPADVANLAAFLLSTAADPLYGTIIPVTRAARR